MGDNGWSYVPILKSKAAEFEALKHLRRATVDMIMPLIDVVLPNPTRSKPPATRPDPAALALDLLGNWHLRRRIAVDVGPLGQTDAGPALIVEIARRTHGYQLRVVPTVHFSDPPDTVDALREAARLLGHGACLRVTAEDLYQHPGDLAVWTDGLLDDLEMQPDEIDLVFDVGTLRNDTQVDQSITTCRTHLGSLAHTDRWRSITVASGAFPQDLSEVEPWEVTELPRREITLWSALQDPRLPLRRRPGFGDYGIDHPPRRQPVPARPAPNVRYAVDGRWLVLRGTRTDPDGNAQFHKVCGELVHLPEWCGDDFSWGDGQIAASARRDIGPGIARSWRSYGTNHHIEFVVHRLRTTGRP
ncbi:hypothetical protein GTS_46790 [Gandjariella thermophila]|uniref:Beta protein n=2 Tax=Gandjariella thermophila TaxID=1931992 RepID=A0A4D4JF81_9PSEU|nr:hypothetical protein GTS_46790 [Gandjariella thermophila]